MNLKDIANIRLISQKIINSNLKTPKEVVNYMGAMQAQDFNMSKWAIGIRIPASTEEKINSAINNGEIIRTHLLRPTWHFVSNDDIYWMLELSAQKIISSLKSRHKQLGLDEKIFSKSNKIIENAFLKKVNLKRSELKAELEKSKIILNDNRAAHLLLRAELDGIICSGREKGNQNTYALLSKRVSKKEILSREESLAKLAQKYFNSRFPVTLKDFIWWSNLSAAEAKKALELIKSELISLKIGNEIYWLPADYSIPKNYKKSYRLLPAFDEFIISYKDRTGIINSKDHKKAISSNGIFWPAVSANGKIIGTWKRIIKKDKVEVQINFFEKTNKAAISLIKKESLKFSNFLNKKLEIKISRL